MLTGPDTERLESALLPPTISLNVVEPVPARVNAKPPFTVEPKVIRPPAAVWVLAAVRATGPLKVMVPVPCAVMLSASDRVVDALVAILQAPLLQVLLFRVRRPPE